MLDEKKLVHVNIEPVIISSLEETEKEYESYAGHAIMTYLRKIYKVVPTTTKLKVSDWIAFCIFFERTLPIMTSELVNEFANLLKNAKVTIQNLGQEDIYTYRIEELDKLIEKTSKKLTK